MLWYEGNALSNEVQAELGDVFAIDSDGSLLQVNETEQSLQYGALASARPPDDPDLHAGLDRKVQPTQRRLKRLSVTHRHIGKDNVTTIRPGLVSLEFFELAFEAALDCRFLLAEDGEVVFLHEAVLRIHLGILYNALRTSHVVLALGDVADADAEEGGHVANDLEAEG